MAASAVGAATVASVASGTALASEAKTPMTPGTYEGRGKGRSATLVVSVTVDENTVYLPSGVM